MQGSLKLVTGPVNEPISLAVAQEHLRLSTPDDDEYVRRAIKAIRRHLEQPRLNRALITQTWDWYLDRWPSSDTICIPLPPLQSITSIKYTDIDGVEATYASSNYLVDVASEPGRVRLKLNSAWPTVELQELNGVVIRFVAGYGDDAGDVPEPIRQAMLLALGDMYENREDQLMGSNLGVVTLPRGVEDWLMEYRMIPV